MSDIRQASIETGSPGSGDRLPGAAAQAGPFLILLAGAVWLRGAFAELPARIPIHWNWNGQPDRFVARTAFGAALPLLMGALLCLLLLFIQRALARNSPRGAMRAPSIKLVLAGEYVAATAFCGVLAATITAGRLLWAVLLVCFAEVIGLLVYTLLLARRAPAEPLRNPRGFRGGVFYLDRDDPALFVPKRLGLGYTLNFGHPGAVFLLVLLIAVPLLGVAAALLIR